MRKILVLIALLLATPCAAQQITPIGPFCPGGSSTNVLFNNAGVCGGDGGFTYAGLGGTAALGGLGYTNLTASILALSPTISVQTTATNSNTVAPFVVAPTVTFSGAPTWHTVRFVATLNNPGTVANLVTNATVNQTSGAYAGQVFGANLQGSIGASNTQNWTASLGLIGLNAALNTTAGATGTVTNAANIVTSGSLAASMTFTTYNAILLNAPSNSGTITNFIGASFPTYSTGTNNTELLMGVGTTGNWGIYDNTGYADYMAGTMTWAKSTYTNCTALTTSSNVMGCTASDWRLKNDLGNLLPSEALAFADAVEVKLYDFKDPKGEFSDNRKHIGFSAQNVQKISPTIAKFMVSKMAPTKVTPDGTLAIDYSEAGPVALAAVKGLHAEIFALKAQNWALRAANDNFERRLTALEGHRKLANNGVH